MQLGAVARYSTGAKLGKFYLRTLRRRAPPGFSKVTLAQVELADEELWRLVREATQVETEAKMHRYGRYAEKVVTHVVGPGFRKRVMPRQAALELLLRS